MNIVISILPIAIYVVAFMFIRRRHEKQIESLENKLLAKEMKLQRGLMQAREARIKSNNRQSGRSDIGVALDCVEVLSDAELKKLATAVKKRLPKPAKRSNISKSDILAIGIAAFKKGKDDGLHDNYDLKDKDIEAEVKRIINQQLK